MGDTEDLVFAGDLTHLITNSSCGFSAYIGINLVEYQNGNSIGICQNGFERQHHASEFTRRGNGTQAAELLLRG